MSTTTTFREPRVDVGVMNEGTILLFYPYTAVAEQWFREWLPADRLTWGRAVVVEHRYADEIVEALQEAGLQVSPTTSPEEY
jgi:hypothetical protein